MKKQDIIKIIEILKATYPGATCSLNFKTPFELGIAVMLSAQCTDERVNKITPLLFEKYKKPEDYINSSLEEIEEIIKPCGFYKNKAKSVLGYAKMIVNENKRQNARNNGGTCKTSGDRKKKCKCNNARSI